MYSLALALREKNYDVSFLSQRDETANTMLKSSGFDVQVFEPQGFDAVAKVALKAFSPDIFIQDVLETSDAAMNLVRSWTQIPVVHFDDCGAGLRLADVVINGFAFLWGKYLASECKAQLFEGPKYMIYNSELSRFVRTERQLPGLRWTVFLSYGGTDTHFITERALAALNVIQTPLALTVNLGPGSERRPSLDAIASASRHRVEVLKAAPNIFQLMSEADLVLCAGGNTLFELAALGVPSISIAAEPHEMHNLNYWSKAGSTLALGRERDLDFHILAAKVEDLIAHPERLSAMSQFGKANADCLGLDRVVEIIESKAPRN